MQGLDLAFKLFVDPGDLVIVEGPTYTNGTSTALSYGAELLEAPLDDNGLVVEALPELVARAGRTPKAIYVIPNFQNPTGTTLALERRKLLLELAERWRSVIIDDDPYGMLRFGGDAIPRFPRAFTRQSPDFFSSHFFQNTRSWATGRLGRQRSGTPPASYQRQTGDGHVYQRAGPACGVCFSRRRPPGRSSGQDQGALPDAKGGDAREPETTLRRRFHTTDPAGGFFLWVTFSGRYATIDTEELFPLALKHGVAYIPGPAFSATGSFRNALRLCFATSHPERIDEGVARLKRAADLFLCQH